MVYMSSNSPICSRTQQLDGASSEGSPSGRKAVAVARRLALLLAERVELALPLPGLVYVG